MYQIYFPCMSQLLYQSIICQNMYLYLRHLRSKRVYFKALALILAIHTDDFTLFFFTIVES